MILSLYNTFTREKEPFRPLNPENVCMYVCGPTVYDYAHIGNARPVVVFDVLFRLLRHLYPKVTYARNITDIDDKIIIASTHRQIPINTLTEETARYYHEDMAALNALPPTIEPKATEHIPQMVNLIKLLIKEGHAYVVEGHVLFQVKTDPQYGQLSHLSVDDRIAGTRVEVAPYKKDPQDFILWKPSTPQQPGWESPWGRGRPGWHIECSAMADQYLGTPFDIHAGGIDLIFPHHENEIAQTCCAYKISTMAQVWMHNGHLIVNGEKMSKSLGNFLTVRQLRNQMPGEVIRLALLSAHYHQPLDWTQDLVTQTENILNKFYTALKDFESTNNSKEPPIEDPYLIPFFQALADDLNTPLALTHLHSLVRSIHTCTDQKEKRRLQALLKEAGNMLGILYQSAPEWFQRTQALATPLDSTEIDIAIQERTLAKKQKDFSKADAIRHTLLKKGILLEDTAQGTTWKYKG